MIPSNMDKEKCLPILAAQLGTWKPAKQVIRGGGGRLKVNCSWDARWSFDIRSKGALK